jgi:hypothetical protein
MKLKRGIAFNDDGQTDDHLMQVKLMQERAQIGLVIKRPKARHDEGARSPRDRSIGEVPIKPVL